MDHQQHDRLPWVAPELKQQSAAATASNEGPFEDQLGTTATSDGIGSVI